MNNIKHRESFEGVCMDDGAQRSSAGLSAYKRYWSCTHSLPELTSSNELFKLGKIVHKSLGKTVIRMPTDDRGNLLEYETEAIDVNLPILFGLDNMKEHRWCVNDVTDEICSQLDPSLKVKLSLKFKHIYLEWLENIIPYSRSGLIRIHLRFAHPTTDNLAELLKRADTENFVKGTKQLPYDTSAICKACQHMESKPYSFQVTMPDIMQFNREVIIALS